MHAVDYSSRNVIRVIKSWAMGWAVRVARMERCGKNKKF
jgi:hypothetical protein